MLSPEELNKITKQVLKAMELNDTYYSNLEVLEVLHYLNDMQLIRYPTYACPNCGGEITGVGHKCLQCEK